jgi:hypothetical protein
MPQVPSAQREATPIAPAPIQRGASPASWKRSNPHSHREKITMQLSSQQLRQFAEEGYLFLPDCFSEEEVAILRDEAEQIYATNRQEVWREKTGAPRTAFAAHTYNEAFRLLGHHPRLIRPVEQVLASSSTCINTRSTPKPRLRGMSGNGTRITAPGHAMTGCRSRAR